MQGFRSQFTQIKGISDRRRLPRLGKIRLGIRIKNKKPSTKCKCGPYEGCIYCTHAHETTYFIVPSEVARVYGDKPTMLDVMFPMNDVGACFPQMYAHFGKSKGIKCMGDGETALQYNEEKKEMEPRECPCEKLEKKDCSQRAYLRVILPKINMGGIYQIDIGSINSITDINSGIDYVRALMTEALGVDRFALIPLVLERKPIETHHEGQKQTHYTIRLYPNITIDQLNKMKGDNRLLAPPQYALPAPVIENPTMDEGAIVEVEEENEDKPPEQVAMTKDSVPTVYNAPLHHEGDAPPGMTSEEVVKDLEEKGMVDQPQAEPPSKEQPSEEQHKDKDKKFKEAQLLNGYAKEIAKFPTAKDLNAWFSKNCLPLKEELSRDGHWHLTKMVNEKLKTFQKYKG